MKITRTKLRKIILEELEGPVGNKKTPCTPDKQPTGPTLGAKQFHAFDPNLPDDADWECNTQVEDYLMHILQTVFIQNNEPLPKDVQAFLFKYFKNVTDDSLPLNRIPVSDSRTLYRGEKRPLHLALSILKNIDWANPIKKIDKGRYIKFPFSGKKILRRGVESYSKSSFTARTSFAAKDNPGEVSFVFEAPRNTVTDNGGFFLDFKDFYSLYNNKDYKIRLQDFLDISNYHREQEVLLIGSGPGDTYNLPFVWIEISNFSESNGSTGAYLKALEPDLWEKILHYLKEANIKEAKYSKDLLYHYNNKVGIDQNIHRPGSNAFFKLFREVRSLHLAGLYNLNESEEELIKGSDIGEFGYYEGKRVPLDYPILYEDNVDEAKYKGKSVELNDPKRGSPKAYVYVNSGKKNKDGTIRVKKVEFGSSLPDAMGDSDAHKKRRKSFGSRHKCSEKNDKTKPGYWACRATKFFGRNISGWW